MEKTGFCWCCGRVCKGLFCDDTCKKKYIRGRKPKIKRKYQDNLWTRYT